MSFNLNYLLNLPGVMVETCAEVEGMISLKLEILVEGINCPHCQKYTEELHQNRPVLVRDLPTFGRKVYLQDLTIYISSEKKHLGAEPKNLY